MNIAQIIETKTQAYEKEIADLEALKGKCLPNLSDKISHAGSMNIFIEDSASIEEVLALLTGNKYELTAYYSGRDGRALTLQYTIGELNYIFFVPLTAENVERVSGGKCHIEVQPLETKEVVCELGE